MVQNNRESKLAQLKDIVEQFARNIKEYKSGNYDEANTRVDYIDKFFTLLGWDVANNHGFSQAYRDVVREDKVKIDGSHRTKGTQAPDYSFRIGGVRKFFVEAKKPSVNIKDDIVPAYQLRRYAYTAKLSLSILTDFEEFAVYDTRYKPNKNDNASVARIRYFTYDQYVDNFDYFYNTFSKEAILKGSFDKYAEENKNKKGTSQVDTELLALVEDWRVELAKNIAKNNPNLSIYNLNTVVQKIIDRIIFIRIAEDRCIEDENLLQTVAKTYVSAIKTSSVSSVYEKLNVIFAKANVKYNSGLFAYEDWIEKVNIDDKVLSNIINNLYYPECPYEFSILPVEILGSIYERFLGKTIRFRNIKGDTHTALIEEKPEVKKAGGVFYTPQYIVNYIVENTVGEKIKNKKPDDITQIKVVDPACGSGSFLVGAYQYLLQYHLDYYTQKKNITSALKNSKIFKSGIDSYRLTIEEKQSILTNNIYGVDIDNQAVEVTKLSLYLKLLEGESKQAEGRLFKHSDMALLPSLEDNIKCGNSLIGTDFYAQGNLDFSEDERIKVNCFDWEKSFADIFKNGGFDVVIGNPPYFNIQTLGANSEIAQYIQKKYFEIWQDKSDILFYFLVKAMQLSKGSIGFILSNAFLFSDKAQKLRNKIIDDGRLEKIVNFEKFMIFEGASITTGIFIFNDKNAQTRVTVLKGKNYKIDDLLKIINSEENYFSVKFGKNSVFALINSDIDKLNEKIDAKHPLLQDIFLVGKGMETAANEVFLFKKFPSKFPKEYMKIRMAGENIKRYYLEPNPDYLLYFEDVEDFRKLPVSIQNHLNENRKILANRADKKRRSTALWWNYTFALHKEYYHLPKIWCSYRSKNNAFILDETSDYIGLTNTTVIFGTNKKFDLKYVLALLNSKLFTFRYRSIGKQTGGGIYEFLPNSIGKFPIPEADKQTQEKFIVLADKIMELKKQEAEESNPQQKEMISRQIEGIDNAIDKAVYELYGLNEDEIRMAEKG